jgi:hypothetical protein
MRGMILDFKLSPGFKCRMFSFGLFPDVCILNTNFSEHSVCSIFVGGSVRSVSHFVRLAYEDGTYRVFRNIGIQTTNAGEQPIRKHTTYEA